MKNAGRTKILILLSGGLDSSACVDLYSKAGFDIQAVFIDYGQSAKIYEKKSALKIAKYYKIKLKIIKYTGLMRHSKGMILGRNAFLIFSVLMSYPLKKKLITLGIHSGTSYYDCSSAFLHDIKIILNGYTDGSIKIIAPFVSWTKKQIWDYCKMNNVPIHLTYSCELGKFQPCGKCLSCKDLEGLYASDTLKK